MALSKNILIFITIVGLVAARYLTAAGHWHVPFAEILLYGGVFLVLGLILVRRHIPITIPTLRAQVHRKYGFTAFFCLACAILLTCVGSIIGPPGTESVPVPILLAGQNGYKEPPVVRIGEAVRLHIYSERRLPVMSISGLWKANILKATLVLDHPRRLIPLNDVATLAPDQTWDDVNPRDGKLYFRPNKQSAVIPKFKNESLFPWIEFTVPYDKRLSGQQMNVHVEMAGVYPYLVTRDEYRTDEFRLIEDVPFYVATDSQYAKFRDYQVRYKKWDAFQRVRSYAAVTFLLCGSGFLILLTREGA